MELSILRGILTGTQHTIQREKNLRAELEKIKK
jgi:hypothetical protein